MGEVIKHAVSFEIGYMWLRVVMYPMSVKVGGERGVVIMYSVSIEVDGAKEPGVITYPVSIEVGGGRLFDDLGDGLDQRVGRQDANSAHQVHKQKLVLA